MSKILVKCIQDVVHGPYTLNRGQEAMMHPHEALDLKAFVEAVPVDDEQEEKGSVGAPLNKMMPESRDSKLGNDQSPPDESPPSEQTQSSASQAAQVSESPIAKPSKAGGGKKQGAR